MEDPIRTTWANWVKDKCVMCSCEKAPIYKKGHARKNGIILEWGLNYCEQCARNCEEHWQEAWKQKWEECEQDAEENWKKHGVYTNVGGLCSKVSFYFGYAKTPEGFKRYLDVFPNCPKNALEKEVSRLRFKIDEASQKRTLTLIEESKADQGFKDDLLASVRTTWDRTAKRAQEKI